MARASGLTTGLTIRYSKKGDSLNNDSTLSGFDGWSTTDSSDFGQNSSWWTSGNGLVRNFEQNFIARDFAFDLKQFKANTAASDIGVATIPSVSAAVSVPASSPLHYFLKVDGVTGDSTVKGFEGWIAVDGYDLGIQNTASIGSASGGAGAGRAQFSPLTVDIHSLSGLTSLFGDAATGHALKSVELVGVESIKDQNIKVYDVKLSDVLVSSFENDPSAKGVETALTFNFAKIQVTDQPVAKNGTLGTPQTFAFDLTELKAEAAVATSDVAASVVTADASSAATTPRRIGCGCRSHLESPALLPEGRWGDW
jgi:type VI protein secretion system component Hcp